MADDWTTRPVTERELQAVGTQLDAFAATLEPRERLVLAVLLSGLVGQPSDEVTGYANNPYVTPHEPAGGGPAPGGTNPIAAVQGMAGASLSPVMNFLPQLTSYANSISGGLAGLLGPWAPHP